MTVDPLVALSEAARARTERDRREHDSRLRTRELIDRLRES